jgi:hypothetical protein
MPRPEEIEHNDTNVVVLDPKKLYNSRRSQYAPMLGHATAEPTTAISCTKNVGKPLSGSGSHNNPSSKSTSGTSTHIEWWDATKW